MRNEFFLTTQFKLQRVWKSTKTSQDIEKPKAKSRRRKKKQQKPIENVTQTEVNKMSPLVENYRNTTHFITPQTSFKKLFGENFNVLPDHIPGICLTGLHTCGNLAPTCLNIFVENDELSAVCNIGCCYHLLNEQFSEFIYNPKRRERSPESRRREICEQNVEHESTTWGFPMSQYLIDEKAALGRNSRMLACQSIHRVVHRRELPNAHLFYRALLEVLIKRRRPEYLNNTEVGRLKLCTSFVEYVRKSANRNPWLGLDEISDDELQNFYAEFESEKAFLDIYFLIRLSVAQAVETVILLDRLLYLKENERRNDGAQYMSYLVRFFDPVISPRCFGHVAIRKTL